MDKLIQPMIETFDIGKMMDTKLDKKKVVFLKNLDMVLKNTIDEKIFKKVTNWLEKYGEAVTFLFSFNICKEFCEGNPKKQFCYLHIVFEFNSNLNFSLNFYEVECSKLVFLRTKHLFYRYQRK
jgi:hypothetical protein